jgi:hypothetical protein
MRLKGSWKPQTEGKGAVTGSQRQFVPLWISGYLPSASSTLEGLHRVKTPDPGSTLV